MQGHKSNKETGCNAFNSIASPCFAKNDDTTKVKLLKSKIKKGFNVIGASGSSGIQMNNVQTISIMLERDGVRERIIFHTGNKKTLKQLEKIIDKL